MERPAEQRLLRVDDGVELWSARSGRPDAGIVVLLSGAAMSSQIWDTGLRAELVSAGLSVLTVDWRDTGRSTWRRFRDHPYGFDRLVDDVEAVIGDWGLDRYSLVGYSMGGCVAQMLAARSANRIDALVLVSSGYASKIDLPASDRRRLLFAVLAEQDSSSRDAMVASLLRQWEVLHGEDAPFDPKVWSVIVGDWLEEGYNPRCPHVKLGPEVFGVDRTERLSRLDVPALVLHGTDDPMFPIEHARALVRTIPEAELEVRPGRGHELFADREIHQLIASHLVRGNLIE